MRLVFLAVVIITSRTPAQTAPQASPPPDQLQRAAALFARQDWSGALDAYTALAKAYPSHALSRFRVGVTLLELNRLAEAETSIREGERLGMAAGQAAFRLAQVAAEQGRRDEAITELIRAATARLFLAPAAVDTSRHLRSLRSHARWEEVLDAFDLYLRPCLHDPRYREFDFWIGDWDVRPTVPVPGAPAGPPARSTITADEDGCVITEHWRPASGSQGRSFNIFDRSYGVWRQTWVDNVGGQHDYRGNLRDGNMVYMAELAAGPGQPRTPTRLTFFNVARDTVRQFSEFSRDSGKTWQTGYDLTYVRRPVTATESTPPALVPAALSDSDRREIAALGTSFVDAWLRDDTTAVLALFLRNAVIVPPDGKALSGTDAMRAYWWPANGPATRLTSFQRTVDGVTGNREVAIVTASVVLTWTSTTNGRTTRQSSRSVESQTLARDPLGKWKIARHAWK
jgi:uncharacterized protein (TIGR02246 family)